MNIRLLVPTLATALTLVVSVPAQAALIDFDNSGGATGTFSFDSSTGIATGTGIGFDEINVTGAPSGDPAYTCSSCNLSFTTPVATDQGGGTYQFLSSGGTLSMSGEVFSLAAVMVSDGNNLVVESGSFTGSPLNTLVLVGNVGILTIYGVDQKDSAFLSVLGLDNPFSYVGSIISLTGCSKLGTVTTCSVQESDFVNTSANVIPEPASLLLLGSGLLGLGYRRRQRAKRA